jgi:ATP-dependent Clp protease ATP-binding subunit ClpC
MFERYTEKARRVIFFARYEASQFGQPYIETEHLLLGLLREDKALTNRFLRSFGSVESIRKQIETHTTTREKISTSVDLPLSSEGKRVLAYTAEEAERLGQKHIGTEHLLLGMLREKNCYATVLLNERGVTLDAVRKELEREPHPAEPRSPAAAASGSLNDFARDLTDAAAEGDLDLLIGREAELESVIEILSRRFDKNPILVGKRGSGKFAIVEGLAQRIADGTAPVPVAHKRIMVLEAEVVAGWTLNRRSAEERLNQAIKAMIDAADVILYIDDVQLLIASADDSGSVIASGILKRWLLRGKIQCIGSCSPAEYAMAVQAVPWVGDAFSVVDVQPLDEEMTVQVLQSRKRPYEEFHGVTYADDALECAARASGYLPGRPLPGKALQLLDAAGARVKLRQGALPAEISEAMKRIRFILQRMDSAIANHEFEKARFYSEEERKERETLRALREQHHVDDGPSPEVRRADIEEVVARSVRYPFQEK